MSINEAIIQKQLQQAEKNNDVGVALEVLYEHMSFYYGERVKSLPVNELATYLEAEGCNHATAQNLVKWFEEAQMQRYAPPGVTASANLFMQALSLFDAVRDERSK